MFLLSIIIPIYNVEKYIEHCFNTLLPQVDLEMEVICIDDGSTDNSYNICQKYAAKYPNLYLYKKKNEGVASARNIGLRKAQGKYIAWVDPDDYVSPEWAQSIRNILVKEKPDCLLFDYYTDNNKIISEEHSGFPYHLRQEDFIFELSVDVRLESMLWSKVIKRKFFDKLQFDENVCVSEDYKILTEISLRVKKIIAFSKCLYYYVKRSDSLLNKNSSVKSMQAAEIAEIRYKTYKTYGYKHVSKASVWKMMILACLNSEYRADLSSVDALKIKSYNTALRKDLFSILKNPDIERKVKIAIFANILFPTKFCYIVWKKIKA